MKYCIPSLDGQKTYEAWLQRQSQHDLREMLKDPEVDAEMATFIRELLTKPQLGGLISAETMREHRARWYVYAGGHGQASEKIPHTAQMRGSWLGWDVACLCGWESKTGGATKTSVQRSLDDHRLGAELAKGAQS